MTENKEIFSILEEAQKEYNDDLIEDMSKVYDQIYTPDYIVDLINSQMDVDRFDYLIRDSMNAGCHYGEFDLKWILRSMIIAETDLYYPSEKEIEKDSTGESTPFKSEVIAIDDKKGRNCVEKYILGRHFMYIHLYYHKTIVAAEVMLGKILERAVDLMRKTPSLLNKNEYPVLRCFAEWKNPDVKEYLSIDDNVILGWLNRWSQFPEIDKTISDISKRLISRTLFSRIIPPDNREDYIKAKNKLEDFLNEKGYDPEYYLIVSERSDIAHKDYLYYINKDEPERYRDIHFIDLKNDHVYRLSDMKEKSPIVAGSYCLKFEETCWYVPKEFRDEANDLIKDRK